MKKISLLIAFLISIGARAQLTPPPRYSFALAFDDARGKMVMFGGYYKGVFMNDTWEWDGVNWDMKSQEGPSPRNGPAITYDSKRKTIILFGGDTGGGENRKSFGDTWEWNGSKWKLLSLEGPPGRCNHTMEYDKKRDRVVLYGGIDSGKIMADLWEWDGVKWLQISTAIGPDGRFLHASTYDEKSGKILVFGGNTLNGPATQESIRGDLWAWDGAKWEQKDGLGPSPRDHVDMVYDQIYRKVVVHGGGTPGGASAGDTWEWDGKTWTNPSIIANVPQAGYKLVYDSKSKRVLLFGGFAGGVASASIWKLGGTEWSLLK